MFCIRPSALPRHGRRTGGLARTSSARHARRRRSVSGRRFVNVRHCRPRNAIRQEISVVGFRKLAWLIQERLFEGSSSCPTRRARAVFSGSFSGFKKLAVTCAAALEKSRNICRASKHTYTRKHRQSALRASSRGCLFFNSSAACRKGATSPLETSPSITSVLGDNSTKACVLFSNATAWRISEIVRVRLAKICHASRLRALSRMCIFHQLRRLSQKS